MKNPTLKTVAATMSTTREARMVDTIVPQSLLGEANTRTYSRLRTYRFTAPTTVCVPHTDPAPFSCSSLATRANTGTQSHGLRSGSYGVEIADRAGAAHAANIAGWRCWCI